MSKLDTAPYKGVRDFYPEDKFIQNHIFKVWHQVSQSFGYEEYDASVIEPSEIYKEKSGEEIVNEQTFTFIDRGGREVTLRPEMTPTVARMVAGRKRELGFPLRLYSIPNLFRYEATQRGRLREHWQLNVDVFGLDGNEAEFELILLANQMMKEFGAKPEFYEIRISSHGATPAELNDFIERLSKNGINNVKVDPELKRGQAYYTGIVFEFFDTNPENSRSILGGGRYNNLTTLFGDSGTSAAGFGWGDVTTKDFLETHNLLPAYKPSTDLCLIPLSIDFSDEVNKLAQELRGEGINIAIDWSQRKIGDMIHSADKNKITYILVLGEDEIKNNSYKIKDLRNGEEKEVSKAEIRQCVK